MKKMSEFTDSRGRILKGRSRRHATHLDGMSRRELRKRDRMEGCEPLPPGECLQCEDVNDCIFHHDLEACGEMLSGLCARCHKPITHDHHLFCEAKAEGGK